MIWARLKDFECPACKAPLDRSQNLFEDPEFYCPKCSFKIAETRFNEIVEGFYKPRASDSYRPRTSFERFSSGEDDTLDEHDSFWLDKKAKD